MQWLWLPCCLWWKIDTLFLPSESHKAFFLFIRGNNVLAIQKEKGEGTHTQIGVYIYDLNKKQQTFQWQYRWDTLTNMWKHYCNDYARWEILWHYAHYCYQQSYY